MAEAYNFTKINTPPWVFFRFFKLYKWYQIVQRTTYNELNYYCYLIIMSNNPRKLLEKLGTGVFSDLKLPYFAHTPLLLYLSCTDVELFFNAG